MVKEFKVTIGLLCIIKAYKPKIPVPARAGTDIKNEILGASSLLKFNILEAVIIIPDLTNTGY